MCTYMSRPSQHLRRCATQVALESYLVYATSCVCMFICICKYIYIYMYVHIYTFTCIYICI